MRIKNTMRLFVLALASASFISLAGLSEEENLFSDLSSFESENLKYEFLKPEHYAGMEAMFHQLDLHKLMGTHEYTPSTLLGAFKDIGENLWRSKSVTLKEPFVLAFGITDKNTGEFIGSATLQTITSESLAGKHSAFHELRDKHGPLFAIGRSFPPRVQGKGYGREACMAIVDQFFRITGDAPVAIISSSFKGNVASGKSIQNCGFTKFLEEKSADGTDEYFDLVHFLRAKN